MKKQLLFLQGGGGKEDHVADAGMVTSLREALGETYTIHYPLLLNEPTADFGRLTQIKKELSAIEGQIILVGHSLGASMLLKFLSDSDTTIEIGGVFLMATPFWDGDEDWVQGLKLKPDFENHLPQNTPIFFYHCLDDKEIPLENMIRYKEKLPRAVFREVPRGGHQFDNNLTIVADDILAL